MGCVLGSRRFQEPEEEQFPQLSLLSASLCKCIQPQALCGTPHKAKAIASRQMLACSRREMHFCEAQTSQGAADDNTCVQVFYLWAHRALGAEPYLKGAVTAILVCPQGVSWSAPAGN